MCRQRHHFILPKAEEPIFSKEVVFALFFDMEEDFGRMRTSNICEVRRIIDVSDQLVSAERSNRRLNTLETVAEILGYAGTVLRVGSTSAMRSHNR